MKKCLLMIIFIISFSACQNNLKSNDPGVAHENRFDNNQNLKTDIEMYKEQENNRFVPDCHTLCHGIIQEVCVDDIVALEADDVWYGDSIMDTDHCESICDFIPDPAKECMVKAKKCDSIRSHDPYCLEEEDDSIVEYIDEKEENTRCSLACYKYKQCALLAADATNQDGNDAYDSCFSECQNWSEETVTCVNNTQTKTNMGCMKLSQCALKEYSGVIEEFQKQK